MLGYWRDECIQKIVWNADLAADVDYFFGCSPIPHGTDCLQVLECWKYEGVTEVSTGNNYRHLNLNDVSQSNSDPSKWHNEFEERLQCWLSRFNKYEALKPEGAGKLQGGLRLVMCDRPNMLPGMTISRNAFEKVESAFDLHDATLPAFFDHDGSFMLQKTTDEGGATTKIHIVVKAVQKVEISNCLLSLTYNVASGWTDAFIRGDGILFKRRTDRVYGK